LGCGCGDTFFIGEVFIKIRGKQNHLWLPLTKMAKWLMHISSRGVMEMPRNVFKGLLPNHRRAPRKIVTDKLASYNLVFSGLIPVAIYNTAQHENERAVCRMRAQG